MPFIPHTDVDTKKMLEQIGESDIEALFDEIPAPLRSDKFSLIPDGISEMKMMNVAQSLAHSNRNGTCFIGAGAYSHFIPAAVWDIASRGEFLTSYTPYQAEASQGTLQLLYEYQTLISELTGMEVANASLYDGASALAEAVFMAAHIHQNNNAKRVLVAGTLHPFYRQTLETIVRNQHIELITLPFDKTSGVISVDALNAFKDSPSIALIIPQPNFFGCLEAVDILTDWAYENQMLSIACVNPVSLGLLNPPGAWGKYGVDIVCGEGQPFGCPLNSGGPYFGFFSTRMEYVRQMPGRLIGRTIDKKGSDGFALTLQAREQHIRRGKATSNICTNQGLLVTAATIHMSLLGPEGLHNMALLSHQNTCELASALTDINGVDYVFNSPYFHEVLLKLNRPVHEVLSRLNDEGIAGGYPVQSHYPELENTLLVCATEARTTEEIAHYAHVLTSIFTG